MTCGCDIAWIFADSSYYDAIIFHGTPTCADGTSFADIDGNALVAQCSWMNLKYKIMSYKQNLILKNRDKDILTKQNKRLI